VACVRSILGWAPMTLGNGQHWWVYESPRTGMLDASGSGLERPLESTHQAAVGRLPPLPNVCSCHKQSSLATSTASRLSHTPPPFDPRLEPASLGRFTRSKAGDRRGKPTQDGHVIGTLLVMTPRAAACLPALVRRQQLRHVCDQRPRGRRLDGPQLDRQAGPTRLQGSNGQVHLFPRGALKSPCGLAGLLLLR